MRRIVVFLMLVAVVAGGYMYRKEIKKIWSAATEYPAANTPKEAAELFRKYMGERDYEAAAHYCTANYAKLLRDGASMAKKLGGQIDGLMDKMKMFPETDTPECRLVLFFMDPFPKDALEILVQSEQDQKAVATMAMKPKNLAAEKAQSSMPQEYRVDPDLVQVFYRELPPKVNMVKEKVGDKVVWRFDFVPPATLTRAVNILNQKGEYLTTELRDLSTSVNNDASVKADFRKHLKDTLEKASK
jgi:hypothetical protein